MPVGLDGQCPKTMHPMAHRSLTFEAVNSGSHPCAIRVMTTPVIET